jgi:hypothetical protein
MVLGLTVGGCTAESGAQQALPSPSGSSPSPAAVPPGASSSAAGTPQTTPGAPKPQSSAGGDVHRRSIGPADQGHEIALRVGDRLDVTPAARPGGWVVANFPPAVLRLQGSPRAATNHTFVAVAVGEGSLVLSPAGPEANSTGTFTVKVKVMRDTVLPPPP